MSYNITSELISEVKGSTNKRKVDQEPLSATLTRN